MFYEDDAGNPRVARIVASVIAVIVLVVIGAYVFRWVTAPAVGKLEAREQIQSGDFRIQAYDHFFNLCAAVQTDEQVLAASQAQLDASNDPTDRQRLLTNITGQTAARAEAVNQYNADAHKSYTIGQFRSSGLPYQLSADYEPGAHTSCGK